MGIATFAYAARCGGCHGAMDGKAEHVLLPPVDLITQASVSASRFAAQDRRRPLPPEGGCQPPQPPRNRSSNRPSWSTA